MKARALPCIVLALAGCAGNGYDADAIAALSTAAPALLEARQGEVPAAQWPAAIRRLHPRRVRADDDGVYVVMTSFFVTEAGLFVPRDPRFVAPAGTDPVYAPVGRGVFFYRVEG